MATIECTKQEFFAAFRMFKDEISKKSQTQDAIGNLWKGLVLHYLGLNADTTESEVEFCASLIEAAGHEARYRGWTLIEPDLSGGE